MNIKKIIKKLANNIHYILLPLNIFFLIKSYSKIIKSEIILFHNKRQGFGNQFTSSDLLRILYPRKQKLIIFFDQKSRHNNYIYSLFNQNFISMKTIFEFEFFKKNIKIGEYEQKDDLNYFKKKFYNTYPHQFIIFFLVKFIAKNRCKIISIDDLYNKAWEIYKKKKKPSDVPFTNKMEIAYKYLRTIKKYKIKFPEELKKKINKKVPISILNSKNKIAFYLRRKLNTKNDPKDSGNFKNYISSLNYLSKKYTIFLIGDIQNIKINKKIKNLYTFRDFKIDKKIYDILFASESEYFIGTSGGGQWFAHYKKKSLLIDDFPYNNINKNITLFKKIYKKRKLLNKTYCLKNFIYKDERYFKAKKYLIKSNTQNEIKRFISKTFK